MSKTYGIQPKKRTLDEINQDYNKNAMECGHKQRIVWQIQTEIDEHIEKMCKISKEAASLNKDSVKTEEKEDLKTENQVSSEEAIPHDPKDEAEKEVAAQ